MLELSRAGLPAGSHLLELLTVRLTCEWWSCPEKKNLFPNLSEREKNWVVDAV